MLLAPGTTLSGKYQIVRKLDEGGGAVFEARHVTLAERYAVKVLCEGAILNTALVHVLQREALAASALSHPGIVRVHDLDQTPDASLFLVMELLNGQDLGRLLARAGKLALSDVVTIVESIASPLEEAHRNGIVHGDLTPEKVFVLDAEADPRARVKLLDFGVASIRAQSGGIVRRPRTSRISPYRAPEQEVGREAQLDQRVDVYALGAIAATLTGGQAPPNVSAAIARATSPHRDDRFRSVTEFATALRAAATGSSARASGVRSTRTGTGPVPVPAPHPPTARVRLPAGMKRTVATAVGCGLAILFGAVVIPKLSRAPQPPSKPAAPAPSAPAPIAAPTPAPPAPPAPAAPAAVSATDGARLPLPPRVHRPRRSAHAEMTEAARREMKESYQKATRAFDLGLYDEAIAAYKRAYELGGDVPMLYNIAQALRLSKRPDEALAYYRRYLSRAPSARNREEVRAKIVELAGASPSPTGATPPASPPPPAPRAPAKP